MRIKYNATVDDFVAFNLFYHQHSAFGRRNRLISGLVVPLGLFLLICLTSVSRGDWVGPIIGLVLAGGLALWVFGGWRRRITRIVRKMYEEGSNTVVVGPREMELAEYGIKDRGRYGESTASWEAIERFRLTSDYTFIFTSAISAIAVRGSTVVEGDYSEFVDCLKRSFEEHKKAQTDKTLQAKDLSVKVISDSAKFYQPDTGYGKHSGYGIASFAISMILGGLYVLLFLILSILAVVTSVETEPPSLLMVIIGATSVFGFFANLVGFGLGIRGVLQKNRKKVLAVLGLVFNSVALLLFTALFLIGSSR